MPRTVAFLGAINVGGHVVRMETLREVSESLGLRGVETFLASGNLIFDGDAAAGGAPGGGPQAGPSPDAEAPGTVGGAVASPSPPVRFVESCGPPSPPLTRRTRPWARHDSRPSATA